ncbi:hypothetical protein IQ268_16735 [Oculatella sp. LEGE 06141]|uniref:hypothetical protein n=1 Tax=Oculatella sp. LEGE 06141 TaxID=1828648 RepID=UPI00188256C1|nr:hypothetical protein [Oculatella sp. LEGE 06141]MBE9180211.1 hypothetical protein [Oculatella sp. LEGE 06141]
MESTTTQDFLKNLQKRLIAGGIDPDKLSSQSLRIQMGSQKVYEGVIGQEPGRNSLDDTKIQLLESVIDLADQQRSTPFSKEEYEQIKDQTIADVYEEYGDRLVNIHESIRGSNSFEYPDVSYLTVEEFAKSLSLDLSNESGSTPKGTINIDLGGDRIFRYAKGVIEIDSFKPVVRYENDMNEVVDGLDKSQQSDNPLQVISEVEQQIKDKEKAKTISLLRYAEARLQSLYENGKVVDLYDDQITFLRAGEDGIVRNYTVQPHENIVEKSGDPVVIGRADNISFVDLALVNNVFSDLGLIDPSEHSRIDDWDLHAMYPFKDWTVEQVAQFHKDMNDPQLEIVYTQLYFAQEEIAEGITLPYSSVAFDVERDVSKLTIANYWKELTGIDLNAESTSVHPENRQTSNLTSENSDLSLTRVAESEAVSQVISEQISPLDDGSVNAERELPRDPLDILREKVRDSASYIKSKLPEVSSAVKAKLPASAIAMFELSGNLSEPQREWLNRTFQGVADSAVGKTLKEKGPKAARELVQQVARVPSRTLNRMLTDSTVAIANGFTGQQEDVDGKIQQVYRCENYVLRVKDTDDSFFKKAYTVEDKQGQTLLEFEQGPVLSRITSPNKMSVLQQLDFIGTGTERNLVQAAKLAKSVSGRTQQVVNTLGNLAPEGTRQQLNEFKTRQVAAIAESILHSKEAIVDGVGQRFFEGKRFEFSKTSDGVTRIFSKGAERSREIFQSGQSWIRSRINGSDQDRIIKSANDLARQPRSRSGQQVSR